MAADVNGGTVAGSNPMPLGAICTCMAGIVRTIRNGSHARTLISSSVSLRSIQTAHSAIWPAHESTTTCVAPLDCPMNPCVPPEMNVEAEATFSKAISPPALMLRRKNRVFASSVTAPTKNHWVALIAVVAVATIWADPSLENLRFAAERLNPQPFVPSAP